MKHIARTQMSKIAEQMQREFDEVLARMSGVSTNDDNVNKNNNNNNQEQDDEETDTDNNKPKKSGREKLLDDLTKAEGMKAKGNADLMRGKILVGHTAGDDLLASACKWYAQALEIIPLNRSTDGYGEDCAERKKALHISLLLNLALASICCKEWDTVLNCTNTILEIDPDNTKGLYRSARAYYEMNEYDSAKRYISKAEKLAPKNKDIQKLSKKIAEAWKKQVRAAIRKREEDEGICHGIDVLLERAQISKSSPLLSFGACLETYAWGQSQSNVHLYIPFACGLPTNNIQCRFTRNFVDITFFRHPTSGARSGMSSTSRVAGNLIAPVVVNECTWMVEIPGLLHVELVKEKRNEMEWWPCIFMDDAEEDRIDTSQFDSLDDEESEMSLASMAEEHQQQQAAKEVEQERIDAIKDPNKRMIVEEFKKNFPDANVHFK